MSMPAETAAMTPCVSFILAPSYGPVNKSSPAAIPIGTVVANDIIIDDRRVRELVGSVAIRVPSDRPSNNWWNVMAVTREVNSDPDAIDKVRPITNEWIMIPTCRTKIPTICLRGDDAGVLQFSGSGCSLWSCEHPATVVESSSAESYGLGGGSVPWGWAVTPSECLFWVLYNNFDSTRGDAGPSVQCDALDSK